jgi:hypothetical protein
MKAMRSKYVSLMVLALTLFTASLALAAAGPRTPANRPVPNRPIVDPTEEIAQSLFVRVPGTEETGSRTVELQVQLDGRPFLTEKLEVDATREDVDVELLARDAATLARLFRMAERQRAQISVAVRLDGSPLHELSFQEMVEASAKLVRSRDFRPRPVASRLELFVPEPPKPDFLNPEMNKGMQPDPTCEQGCSDAYMFCSENCDQRGSCAYCTTDYQNCVASCPQVCVDPKRVYDFTSTQLVGVTTYYSTCYELPNQSDYQWGEWFDYRQYQWKNTRIRRTEYCNGTYSDQVLSVSYSSTYCSYRTYQICAWPATRINSWQICL